MERGALRVKGLQEHITISPARARTQTARCGDERANHEATVKKYTEDSKLKKNCYLLTQEFFRFR